MEDKRFSHIARDSKFRRVPKGQSKVKIDKRFQSMFTDKKFQVKYTVDKRGRPIKHHSAEDLKRYYEVSSEEEDKSSSNEGEDELPMPTKSVESSDSEEKDERNDDIGKEYESKLIVKHKSDKMLSTDIKEKLLNLNIDYARGEQSLYSESSSDDEETDEDVSEGEEIDHKWGELDGDAESTEKATYRLAACNLDWDRIRAVDLMVLFNSFLPPGGVIQSVIIYPSEFGKQRMQEEDVKGPIELVESNGNERSVDETEEGSKYHMEKLRQYQLNRLKYYYAVISFDSASSANKIYSECEGMEYESSATKIDLRFIPDDMSFDDVPKDSCQKLPEKYEPRFFMTTALQQAKVDLTWDETNPDRLEFTEKINKGKVNDFSEQDLQNYLAVSSGEENSGSETENNVDSEGSQQPSNVIDKYKALLQDIEVKEEQKKNNDVEMEISWGINLKEKTNKLVKEKIENSMGKTPFQKYLDKRKEKRREKRQKKKTKGEDEESEEDDIPSDIDMDNPYFAEEFNDPEFKKTSSKKKNKKEKNLDEDGEEGKQKQAELELLLMDEKDADKNHFNLKKIQDNESDKKRKKKTKRDGQEDIKKNDDEFQVDVSDNRFSALFTSHHFNIDPTDPHYKKTKAMETLIQEKIKRRNEESLEKDDSKKGRKEDKQLGVKKDVELNVLVKSVKRKTGAYKNK